MELKLSNGHTPNGWLVGPWNRVWDEFERGLTRNVAPRADVIEDAEGYHFYFDMPGLKADSADVRYDDGSLVIEAERKSPEWPKDATVHMAERASGKLYRAFRLPEDAAHENIGASYRDGVLEVTVPKRPESKPVKIKVQFNN